MIVAILSIACDITKARKIFMLHWTQSNNMTSNFQIKIEMTKSKNKQQQKIRT